MVERAARDAPSSADATIGSAQLLRLSKERTDAILHIHEELLDAYCDASEAWLKGCKPRSSSGLTWPESSRRALPFLKDCGPAQVAFHSACGWRQMTAAASSRKARR